MAAPLLRNASPTLFLPPSPQEDASSLRQYAADMRTMGRVFNAAYPALFSGQLSPENFAAKLQTDIPGGAKVGDRLLASATALGAIADRLTAASSLAPPPPAPDATTPVSAAPPGATAPTPAPVMAPAVAPAYEKQSNTPWLILLGMSAGAIGFFGTRSVRRRRMR